MLGIMTLGVNTAAVEWVHALLMGLNPERIPLIREAFVAHRYPLTHFPPNAILVQVDGLPVAATELFAQHGYAFRAPSGWQGHCELGCPTHVS